MRPEASLWDYLRKLLPKDHFHYSRIESETSPGFPDVYYTYLSISGTIELKSAKDAPMGKRGLRNSQIEWLMEEIEAGGNSLLCLEVGLNIYWLNAREHFRFVNDYPLSQIEKVADVSWTRYRNKGFRPGALQRLLLKN